MVPWLPAALPAGRGLRGHRGPAAVMRGAVCVRERCDGTSATCWLCESPGDRGHELRAGGALPGERKDAGSGVKGPPAQPGTPALRFRDEGAGTAPSDTALAHSEQERLCKKNQENRMLRPIQISPAGGKLPHTFPRRQRRTAHTEACSPKGLGWAPIPNRDHPGLCNPCRLNGFGREICSVS